MQRKRAAERHDSDGPPTGPPADLYRQDFHAWAAEQAQALHEVADSRVRGKAKAFHRAFGRLDLENLAEEIAGLAKSEQRELRHRLTTLVEHLAKLQFSPAPEPRAGWRSTVRRGRIEIARLLEDSPSLKAELPAALDKAWEDAWALVLAELKDRDEALAQMARLKAALPVNAKFLDDHTLERVLDPDWWPPMEGGT